MGIHVEDVQFYILDRHCFLLLILLPSSLCRFGYQSECIQKASFKGGLGKPNKLFQKKYSSNHPFFYCFLQEQGMLLWMCQFVGLLLPKRASTQVRLTKLVKFISPTSRVILSNFITQWKIKSFLGYFFLNFVTNRALRSSCQDLFSFYDFPL